MEKTCIKCKWYTEDKKLAVLNKMDWAREPVQDAHAAHAKQIFVNGEDEKGKKEKYKAAAIKNTERKEADKLLLWT